MPAFDPSSVFTNRYYKFNCVLLTVLSTIVDHTARQNVAGADTLSRYGDDDVCVGLIAQRHRADILNHGFAGLAGVEHFVMNGIVGFLDVIGKPTLSPSKAERQTKKPQTN